MSTIIPLTPHPGLNQPQTRVPKPDWLKVRMPGSEKYLQLKKLMRGLDLHTVCEEAHCPNIGECWTHGTATFMILGDVCTRACGYCAVSHGKPVTLDLAEPARVADAVKVLGSELRRDHVGRSRRSGRWRRADLRGDDPPDARGGARDSHRSADPRLPGQGRTAADRARRGSGHPQSQHRNRAAPLPLRAFGRPLSAHARTARSRRAPTRRTFPPRPA